MIQERNKQCFKEGPPFKLHVKMLEGINLGLYPKNRTHYLAYALQFGFKLPSVSSMDRSDLRNFNKSSKDKAAQIIGRPLPVMMKQRRMRFFSLPNKFGTQPVRASQGRMGRVVKVLRYHPRRVQNYSKPISLPKEVERKNRGKRLPKQRTKAIKIYSPESLILKAERAKFQVEIEKYRQSHPGVVPHKETPLYFIKKKASQVRRRKDKHKLIKDNKEALVKIFGDAIFKSGWPVSRKEIKFALGIKEEDHGKEISLAEFMNMAETNAKNEMESKYEKVKNRLAPVRGEVSRMVRKGPSSLKTQPETKPLFQKNHIQDSDDFPSLLNN